MTRILLVDDETLIRSGLRRLLELTPEFEVTAEAVDGFAGLEAIERTTPDIVLLDIRMPRLDGFGVLDALQNSATPPPCLVLTTFDEPELLLEAARRAARGFISKAVSVEELQRAVRAVAAGGTWFQPAATANLRECLNRLPRVATCEPLSDREIEVLRLMAGGLSNREIAATFSVADGTVKNQVSSILAKLGVHDRTLAVLRGIQAGFI